MKKYIYTLIAFSFLVYACSDSYLDKQPLTSLSSESFWKTEKDLQLALNKLYKGINPGVTGDKTTLDSYGESQNSISSGNNSANNTDGTYNGSYDNIRICNDFLENYEKALVSDAVKNRYKGEALFFRAFFHYNLCKRFGDIIIANATFDFDSELLYGKRNPRDEAIAFIVRDLEEASSYLPKQSEINGEAYGRVTKGANDAFLARVALYFGTLKKYSNESGHEALIQKAKEYANLVMLSQEYELYKDGGSEAFHQLFLEQNEKNVETILSYQYSEAQGANNGNVRALLTDNYSNPAKNLADAFLMNNGLPIDHPSSEFNGYTSKNSEFVNRDQRMLSTFMIPGVDKRESDGAVFETNTLGTFTTTGYSPKKYTYLDAPGIMNNYTDIINIRYAEILLIYAEASFELGATGGTLDSDLNKSINLLRDRVGMPHLTSVFVTDNGLDMKTEIRRERQVELGNESRRYDDLIRWRTAVEELNADIIGAPVSTFSSYTGAKITIDGIDFVLVESASGRNFAQKNYLFPLPIVEWQLNENLLPNNPGWDN